MTKEGLRPLRRRGDPNFPSRPLGVIYADAPTLCSAGYCSSSVLSVTAVKTQRSASKKNRQWHLSSIFSIPQALGSEDYPSHRTWDLGFSDLTRVSQSDMALVGKATPMFSFRKQMYSYDQCMLGITLGHRVILKRSQHIDQKNGS